MDDRMRSVVREGIFLVLMFIPGCIARVPVVPSTLIVVRLAAVDEHITVEEIAEDRPDYLEIIENGRMALHIANEPGPTGREEIGERLSITPQARSFATPIGDIHIAGREVPMVSIGMAELLNVEGTSGTLTMIPAVQIDHLARIPLPDVEFLEIAQGHLDVLLRNGLPVALEDAGLTLVDLGREGTAIDHLDLGDIAGGFTAGSRFVLDGEDISGDLGMLVRARTSPGTNVVVEKNSSLDISGSLSDLLATRATALIPQQVIVDHQVMPLSDDRIQTDTATVRTGEITLTVRNELPVAIDVELGLEGFSKPDGDPQFFTIAQLPPGGEGKAAFEVAGSEFVPQNPLEVRLFYQVTTFPSDRIVTLRSSDVIAVDGATTEDLILNRVVGKLNRVEVPFKPIEKKVDFPQGLGNIALESSSLDIFLTSAVGFSSEVALDIEGTNNAGQQGNLQVREIFPRGDPEAPVPVIVTLASRELTEFLDLLPTHLTIAPTVFVGDGLEIETIETHHWVQIDSIVFRSGPRFRIRAATQVRPDPRRRRISDGEIRQRIRSNVESARAFVTVKNHTPLGLQVSLRIARRREEVYTHADLVIPSQGTFAVKAAPVDSREQVVETVVNEYAFELTGEEIEVFLEEEGVYTGVLIEFDATAGDVEMFGTDFVHIQTTTEFVISIDGGEL